MKKCHNSCTSEKVNDNGKRKVQQAFYEPMRHEHTGKCYNHLAAVIQFNQLEIFNMENYYTAQVTQYH